MRFNNRFSNKIGKSEFEKPSSEIGDDEFAVVKSKKGVIYKLAQIGVISVATISLLAMLYTPAIDAYRYLAAEKLPADMQDIENFYEENDVHTSYSILSSNSTFTRLSVIKGKPVKFNILMEDLTEQEKSELQASIDELNAIFEVINPAYKFELDLTPSKKDIRDPYNVDVSYMTEAEILENKDSRAFYNKNVNYVGKNGDMGQHSFIKFKPGCVNRRTFTHEILHHLGLGDAYLIEEAQDTPSIMHNDEPYIRKNDIALLVARYGDYSTPEKERRLIEYIETYEQNQDWFKKLISDASCLVKELKELLPIHLNTTQDQITYNFDGQTVFGKNIFNTFLNSSSKIIKFENGFMHSSVMNINSEVQANNSLASAKISYSDSVSTINIDGVLTSTKGYNEFFFCYDNAIYRAYKPRENWTIIKVFDICSEEEYKNLKNSHNKYESLNIDEINKIVIDQIVKAVSVKKPATFDFDEFKENSFQYSKVNIYFDEAANKVHLNDYLNDGLQDYVALNDFLILDCGVVVFQNQNGEFAFGYLIRQMEGEEYQLAAVHTLDILNEKEKE